jgi:hypothetical protein
MKCRLFVPITKVDLERREVWGVLAEEAVDKVREIFDYAGSKPHFQAWSDDFAKRTGGVSLGNLREMHGQTAAGKFIAMDFDDAAKKVRVGAKVVDEAAWQKCAEGVYTGFSLGGAYVSREPDATRKNVTRYVAKPSEGSLVDNPCMVGATFEALKADGSTELRKFQAPAAVAPTRAALVALRDRGAAALAALMATGLAADAPLGKGLWSVGRLASLLDDLRWLTSDATDEADYEGDGSTVPARLAASVRALGDALVAMAEEEVAEATAALPGDAGGLALLAARTDGLEKSGRRNSSADQKRLNSMHDTSVALGADCAATKAAPVGAVEGAEMDATQLKAALDERDTVLTKGLTESVTKAIGETVEKAIATALTEPKAQRDALTKALEAQGARLAALETSPGPGKGVASVAAEKALGLDPVDDPLSDANIAKIADPMERALALTKRAHRTPRPMYPIGAAATA